MESVAATDPTGGIYNYLFTQGVLGVVAVGLIIVVIYLVKKLDKKEVEIAALNKLLLDENKAHTADYREMAKNDQEVMNNTSQNVRILSEKIEVGKGR